MDEPFDSPRFMIYKYHCKSVLHLSNDNLGLLFRTICEYQIDKDSLDKIDPRIAQVFPFFKNQFDLDDKKYQKRVKMPIIKYVFSNIPTSSNTFI